MDRKTSLLWCEGKAGAYQCAHREGKRSGRHTRSITTEIGIVVGGIETSEERVRRLDTGRAPLPIHLIWGGNCLPPFEVGEGRGLEGEQLR
jgi:hypothetical protein